MRMPLDSLSYMDWAVYSDWCRDQDREKAANWCQRVSKALAKLEWNGTDPRQHLVLPTSSLHRPGGLALITGGVELSWFLTVENRGRVWEMNPDTMFFWNKMYWVTPRKVRKEGFRTAAPPRSPVDLGDPWKLQKLSMKFFANCIRRATGIRS